MIGEASTSFCTAPTTAREIPYQQTLQFVARTLQQRRGTLLDVGCGNGAIAARLQSLGFRVTAIDVSTKAVAAARENGVDCIESDFLKFEGGPFDTVLFSASLHHLYPLSQAFDRLRSLLKPGGVFIADEFGIDRVTAGTARWYYDAQSILEAAGLFPQEKIKHPEILDSLERWKAEHHHVPPLHGSQAMIEGARRSFPELRMEEGPYLYRYLCQHLRQNAIGLRVGQRVFQLETDGTKQGSLDAVGLRMWSTRPAGG